MPPAPPAAASRVALEGLAMGAALGLAGHLGLLALNAPGAPSDATSRRVTAELVRLGSANARFFVALAVAVTLVAGLVGAATALLLRSVRAWRSPAQRRWATLGVSAALLLGWTARAFVAQPALLEPSLGGAHGRLAPALSLLAAHMPPRAFDALLAVAVAVALARQLGGWRTRALALGAPAVLAVGLTHGWPHRRRAPTLLVLAADSLRPDHFNPATTPHLSALAARGVSFDAALTPIARTTPSWISMLTGLYPHAHGVRDMFPARALRSDHLDYLPRRLADDGLTTTIVSDYAGDFFPLFDLGFTDERVPPPLTLGLVYQREVLTRSPLALALLNQRVGRAAFPVFRFLMSNADADRLADEVLAAIDAHAGRPAAVFTFFSTTHIPFAAPYPYYRRFTSPRYGGPQRYAFDVQRLTDLTTDAQLPAADAAQVRALYDGALASVDAAMGRILDEIDEHTLVVLLADHGENLFEPGTTTQHGKWFKGGDESIRVPLVFAGAGVPRGVRVPEPVSLIDLAPTVAELLHLPATAGADGLSLVPALTAGHAPARDLFAETGLWLNGPATDDGVRYPALPQLLEADPNDRFQLILRARYQDITVEAKHRMLRRGTRKLLYIPTVTGARYELYDLAADPAQRDDLFARAPDAPLLARALRRFLARDPERELDARDHLVRRTED